VSGVFIRVDEKLVALREQPYEAEAVLQRLLADFPALLAGDEDGEANWLLIRREASIRLGAEDGSRGSLDHLFVDAAGTPTLVEVKRSSDSRVRREVVGQMLDYAANARTQWAGDALRAAFESRFATAPEDADQHVRDILRVEDVDEFWDVVRAKVEAERFRLVFVADAIPAELRRIVEYLNAQMTRTEVVAIEVAQFADPTGVHEVFVPRLIGSTELARAVKGEHTATTWNRDSVLAKLGERFDARLVDVARRLLTWADAEPQLRVSFGNGTRDGSFSVGSDAQPGYLWPFTLYTYGKIELQFQYMVGWPPFGDAAQRAELRGKLMAIPGMDLPVVEIAKRPSFPLELLTPDEAFAQFTDAMEWAFRRAAETPPAKALV
jgi:hypothetical protein